MIRENKIKYLISSIIIVLPFLVSVLIKDSIGNAVEGAWYFSWIMPLVLWGIHTGLLVLTRFIDPVKQDKKIENIIFFIIPAISFYTGAVFIAIMLGAEVNISFICAILLGVSFIIMGNYLPKAKRNRTFGLKIKWTMTNDDNWVATHRLSGKLFVIAGVIVLFTAFLPAIAMFITLFVILVAIVAIPIVYSYKFYKKQIESGEATEDDYSYDKMGGKVNKKLIIITVVVTVVAIVLLMFTGSIKFELGDDSLKVSPSLGGGIELKYSELKNAPIYYVEEKVPGTRVMGVGAANLLYGQFQNEEFGNYTRYTYTASESSIIIHLEDEVIVLADESTAKTLELYEELITKINAIG